MTKVLFIDWCAKDALEGTQILEPMEELAYRRILDFIYSTNDNLPDDDKRLARLTKTGRAWKSIKQTLIDFEKIEVNNGLIRNKKCTAKLDKARRNIAQKSAAGNASLAKFKSLKNNNTGSTAVTSSVTTLEGTSEPTGEVTNLKPIRKKKINKKRKEPPLPEEPNIMAKPVPPPTAKLWFEGEVLRLNEADFKAFETLHGGGNTAFMDYLQSMDIWYQTLAPSIRKSWFMATKADLKALKTKRARR